jgi:hypothetical protein
MSTGKKITSGILLWVMAITAGHLALNVDWSIVLNDRLPQDKRKLNVAYIPVT